MHRVLSLAPACTFVTLSLLTACADSAGTPPETEAGTDGPATDAPSTGDSPSTDGPSCPNDAAVVSCCCEGDLQATPTCGSDGALTCAAGYGLYHGTDCSCTSGHGPCCNAASTLDASDASDAPTDASSCPSPQVLRYETAGCGASARPVCGSADQDACFGQVCGCDGTTLVKCDYATAPWSRLGPCGDAGEGGVDAADQ